MAKRPHNRLLLVWLLLCCALFAACGVPASPSGVLDTTSSLDNGALAELPPAPAYRIGIQTEVTGSGAQIGDLSIRAARLAVEQINADGGVDGVPLELVVRDCRSDVSTALAQYRAAVSEDDLVALLGPVKSAYAVPIVRQHLGDRLPLFIGATNTTLTEQGDVNLFQMRPSIRVTAAAMVALAVEQLGATRVGIIYDGDLHGTNGAERLTAELAKADLVLATQAGYTTATTDYDPIARQIAAAKLDTVFIYGTNPIDIGRLLLAIRYRAPTVQIVTSPGGSSMIAYNLAGDAQDGIYVALDSRYTSSPEGARFVGDFRARFSLDPDTYVTWYYDAIFLIAQTLRDHGGVPDDLSAAIRVAQFSGAQGPYRFDARGEGLHEVALAAMRGGEPQVIGSYDGTGLYVAVTASANQ